LTAIEILRQLQARERPATADEQQALARWSSWGAVPEVFDEDRDDWAAARAQLHELLDDGAYAAARRTTINAHFTDPAYVSEMWAALERLGFDGGRVLEPGAGAGTFIGMAPLEAEMIGVELDPTSAAIAQALYPDASVRAESFADTRLPGGHVDAVIGNVPFADVRLYDPRHNAGAHSMHNHFIIKSLALTRPGGVAAVLTSRYTLDAQNPAARREMNDLADLIGAVRLPSGAHGRAAGTEVVTDLLLFRRREPDAAPASTVWELTRSLDLEEDVALRVNAYFDEHPEHVLGTYAVGQGLHGAPALRVVAPSGESTVDRLAAALREITATAIGDGQTFAPRPLTLGEPERVALEPATGLWDGHLAVHPDGRFTRVLDGAHTPLDVPASQRVELRALLALRDSAKALLTAEAASIEDSPELDALRRAARGDYDRYVARYGPINRFALRRTGREDATTGQPRMARVAPPVMRTLRSDPFAPLVMALESFDDTTQTAVPATLLTQRTLVARAPVLGVERPEEALAVCLEIEGHADLQRIAELLGNAPEEARDALGELVFDDPASGRLIPAPEYLSGNVRDKLEEAIAGAAERPELAVNVAALQAVIPPDLGMDDVQRGSARRGSTPRRTRRSCARSSTTPAWSWSIPAAACGACAGATRRSRPTASGAPCGCPRPRSPRPCSSSGPCRSPTKSSPADASSTRSRRPPPSRRPRRCKSASASGCGKTPRAAPGCWPSTTAASTRLSCATTPPRVSA
jgi:hypothetical protein